MTFLLVSPVILSAILFAAHCLRSGLLPLALLALLLPLLLIFRRIWAARVCQIFLVLAALEWTRTLIVLVGARQADGQPWLRLFIILGTVVVFTAGSALVLNHKSLRKRYGQS